MNVAELLTIALVNADESRVEVTAVEHADFSTEAVAGLAELVYELTSNAVASSQPAEKVRIAGLFVSDSYLISISDQGAGISEEMMDALNRMLEHPDAAGRSPELGFGLRVVARLAARNGLAVRLVPGAPGTTARITIPARLVRRVDVVDLRAFEEESPLDASPQELDIRGGRVYAVPAPAGDGTEAFLESVFAPLRSERRWPFESRSLAVAPELRVRVPGESYLEAEDGSPSVAPAEGAVDLRSALSTFDEGRRSAREAVDLVERVDRAG